LGGRIAGRCRASGRPREQLRTDTAAICTWLGAEDGTSLTTEQHEQFARGVEAYLMEGRAPSEALRGAFQRFKAWLIGIYRTMAGLRVSLDPDIRGVFDRLIASDEEIKRARQSQGMEALFRTPEDAGMVDMESRKAKKAHQLSFCFSCNWRYSA
jgi:hypothetical protein